MIKQVVNNYNELQSEIDAHDVVYCLLYKAESKASHCAIDHLSMAAGTDNGGMICMADVSKVRDIHLVYNVTSVPTLLVFKNKELTNQVKGCNDTRFYKNLIDGSYFVSKQAGDNKQKNVTVYTSPTCTYCNSLKSYLKKLQIHFREVDVSKSPEQAQQLVSRTGQQGVPQTEINGKFVVGFDKHKSDKLLELQ
ncbi:MAG: glutaredoxin domain-containing protein [Candidatus Delongbacteria bacterium]|jgi:glutaredoxin-like YruB-family protein|nr:glutaredoxin domain-containing protein [Candidatus Delongbacteria bacterium]